MSVVVCVCLRRPGPQGERLLVKVEGLSLALRSHDQIPASHWSSLPPSFGNLETWRLGNSVTRKLGNLVTRKFGISEIRKIRNSETWKLGNLEIQKLGNSETRKLRNLETWKLRNSKTPPPKKISKIVSVLLSASVERVGVSRMQDFC